jgi:hypothetical protein
VSRASDAEFQFFVAPDPVSKLDLLGWARVPAGPLKSSDQARRGHLDRTPFIGPCESRRVLLCCRLVVSPSRGLSAEAMPRRVSRPAQVRVGLADDRRSVRLAAAHLGAGRASRRWYDRVAIEAQQRPGDRSDLRKLCGG